MSEIEELREWLVHYRNKVERLREENGEILDLIRAQQQLHRTLLEQLFDARTVDELKPIIKELLARTR